MFSDSGSRDIRQTADVTALRVIHDGSVEIRLVLNQVEPLVGYLRAVARPPQDPEDGVEIRFTGWLGLLRALYEMTEATGDAAAGRR